MASPQGCFARRPFAGHNGHSRPSSRLNSEDYWQALPLVPRVRLSAQIVVAEVTGAMGAWCFGLNLWAIPQKAEVSAALPITLFAEAVMEEGAHSPSHAACNSRSGL